MFLGEARDSLSIRPQTVEEIGKVNIRHAELAKKKPEVYIHFLFFNCFLLDRLNCFVVVSLQIRLNCFCCCFTISSADRAPVCSG